MSLQEELLNALEHGNTGLAESLIIRGARIDQETSQGRTPLQTAAVEGNALMVKMLLRRGANINKRDTDKKTALHHASIKGCNQIVEALLDKGANINSTDKYGNTALHYTALNGWGEVVKLLINRGAKVQSLNQKRLTALHFAADRGLVKNVIVLLDAGAKVNSKAKNGKTPLHCAVLNGGSEVLQLLIERGAHINSELDDGSTALHRAVFNGQEIVKLLLQFGADVNNIDNNARTALHRAAVFGSEEVVKVLVEGGADICKVDNDGWTALHFASSRDHPRVVEVLLDHKADIHLANTDGKTAIHLAMEKRNETIVAKLWRLGAVPFQKNTVGQTPPPRLQGQKILEKPISKVQYFDFDIQTSKITFLWYLAQSTTLTWQLLLEALRAEYITSFKDFILAHHLLLLAVNLHLVTRSQIASLVGSRDYLLENVYLPASRLGVDRERKLLVLCIAEHAREKNFIRARNIDVIKSNLNLHSYSEICNKPWKVFYALVFAALEITSLYGSASGFDKAPPEIFQRFEYMADGNQNLFLYMRGMYSVLQKLHSVTLERNQNFIRTALAQCYLSIVPLVESERLEPDFPDEGTESEKEIGGSMFFAPNSEGLLPALDVNRYYNPSFLISTEFMGSMEKSNCGLAKFIIEQSDFRDVANFQQQVSAAIEGLESDKTSEEVKEEEIDTELHQRYRSLVSKSPRGAKAVSAMDAIIELQQFHQLRIGRSLHGLSVGAEIVVSAEIVEQAVICHMQEVTGHIDEAGFIGAYYKLINRYPIAFGHQEPPLLRETFQNASGLSNVLGIKLAKQLLYELFKNSSMHPDRSSIMIPFTRTRLDWNGVEVEDMLKDYTANESYVGEEEFVAAGMKVLFL